jgi:hypothetical protein
LLSSFLTQITQISQSDLLFMPQTLFIRFNSLLLLFFFYLQSLLRLQLLNLNLFFILFLLSLFNKVLFLSHQLSLRFRNSSYLFFLHTDWSIYLHSFSGSLMYSLLFILSFHQSFFLTLLGNLMFPSFQRHVFCFISLDHLYMLFLSFQGLT